MILVADSGSTKTAWCIVNQDNREKHTTTGINPYFQSTSDIEALLINELLSSPYYNQHKDQISDIYFYGSGCSNNMKKGEVQAAFSKVFHHARICIEHDLLAAARALCGREAGIAAIIGTGANTCFYDGHDIVFNQPALGYILGDEGSGAYLGKTLIQSFLNLEMPTDVEQLFVNQYGLTSHDIIETIYKKPLPNRFLASFAPFISAHIEHPFFRHLVNQCLEMFVTKHILKYPQHKTFPVNCTGSIASVFHQELTHVASLHGVKIGDIIKNPLDNLISYHLS